MAPGYVLLERVHVDGLTLDFQNEHLDDSCYGTVVGLGQPTLPFWEKPKRWSLTAFILWLKSFFNPFCVDYTHFNAMNITSQFYDHPINFGDLKIGDIVTFIPLYNNPNASSDYIVDECVCVRYDNLTAIIVDGKPCPIGENVPIRMDLDSIEVGGGIQARRSLKDAWEVGCIGDQKVVTQPRYAIPIGTHQRSMLDSDKWYSIPRNKIMLYVD